MQSRIYSRATTITLWLTQSLLGKNDLEKSFTCKRKYYTFRKLLMLFSENITLGLPTHVRYDLLPWLADFTCKNLHIPFLLASVLALLLLSKYKHATNGHALTITYITQRMGFLCVLKLIFSIPSRLVS